jgi:hypothetical protein
MKSKRIHRRQSFTKRPLSAAEKKRWNDAADKMLTYCRDAWELSSGFDTAVRDSVATGIAYLVHAAFDCRSIALDFKDFESWISFIDNSTAEWFRERGFVEWFSAGAASLFSTQPPRRLAERPIVSISRKSGKVKRAA